MNFSKRFAFAILLAAVCLARSGPVSAGPEAERKQPDQKQKTGNPTGPKAGQPGERGGGDPLRHLSDEEREKFRDAMRRAWNDPAVLQARDEVKKATVAYQKALTEAIKRTDPEAVALMEKVRAAFDSPIKRFHSPGGRGRPGGGGFRELEGFITGESPGFLKDLSEEQRKIYGAARERALKSPEFQEVFGKLGQLRKNDDELRNQRIDLFGRVRKILNEQIIKADGRVKAFLPKEAVNPPGPPSNGRRGPGPSPGSNRKKPEEIKSEPPVPRKKPEKD